MLTRVEINKREAAAGCSAPTWRSGCFQRDLTGLFAANEQLALCLSFLTKAALMQEAKH